MDVDDPEELEICPYDPVHVIRRKRFPYHLVKCRKNYSQHKFKSCPFNARHVVPNPELNYHIRVCPDRNVVESRLERVEKSQKGNTEVPSYLLDWMKPSTTESWDDDDVVVQPKRGVRYLQEMTPPPPMHPKTASNGGTTSLHHHHTTPGSEPMQQAAVGTSMGHAYPRAPPLMEQQSANRVISTQGNPPPNLGRGRGRLVQMPVRQPREPVGTVQPITNDLAALAMAMGPQASLPQPDPARMLLPDHLKDLGDEDLRKRERKLTKMLRQIERLEQQRDLGENLDGDQLGKIGRKDEVLEQLGYLKPLNLT